MREETLSERDTSATCIQVTCSLTELSHCHRFGLGKKPVSYVGEVGRGVGSLHFTAHQLGLNDVHDHIAGERQRYP